MLFSSALVTLVLAMPEAEARARHLGLLPFVTDTVKRVSVVTPDDSTIVSVTAEVESDAGG